MSEPQLLIEDSGFLFKAATLHITEATGGKGEFIVKGVPATVLDTENNNGRIYSTGMMRETLANAKQTGLFEDRRLLCSSDGHPSTTHVEPIKASHVVTDAYIRRDQETGKNMLFCDWLVLGTDNGRNLKSLIDSGISYGTSIRGLGQFNEGTKQIERYEFLGCDGVGNPSAGTFSKLRSTPYEVKTEAVTTPTPVKDAPSQSRAPVSLSEASPMNPHVQNAIDHFIAHHYREGRPPIITTENRRDIVSELLMVERSLINTVSIDDMRPFLDMKEEILGKAPPVVETAATRRASVYESARDLHNRSERQGAHADLAMEHLERTIVDMRVERDRAVARAKASDQLVNALNESLHALPEKIKSQVTEEWRKQCDEAVAALKAEHEKAVQEATEAASAEKTQLSEEAQKKQVEMVGESLNRAQALVDTMTQKHADLVESVLQRNVAVVEHVLETCEGIIRDVQTEAHEVITGLEARLTTANVIGNTLAEHFSALRAVNKTLVEELGALTRDKSSEVRYASRDARIQKSIEARRQMA